METDNSISLMEILTKVNMLTVFRKDLAFIFGPMEANSKVISNKDCEMVTEYGSQEMELNNTKVNMQLIKKMVMGNIHGIVETTNIEETFKMIPVMD